jgi:Protein of unknown function (DUF2000)
MVEALPDENAYRFVAVLNKTIQIGTLLNALGHMTAGLVGGDSNTTDFCFLQYQDGDGNAHPSISHYPFIVLKARNSQALRAFRGQLIAESLRYTDFTSSMTIGTSTEQQNRTRETPEAQLEYYGVCTFGPSAMLRQMTRKFSLFS